MSQTLSPSFLAVLDDDSRFTIEKRLQGQSVNLFFTLPKATEPQEVHDEYMQYVNDVHWYGMNKLKSLYYFRSNAARTVENVNVKVPRINLEDTECIACEG